MNRLAFARGYAGYGWRVVWAPKGEKRPVAKGWPTLVPTDRDLEDWFGRHENNLFVVTGPASGIVVLDCDDDRAEAYWHREFGAVLNATAQVQTSKGKHYYFKLPEGATVANIQTRDDPESGNWDVRGEGGGVAAPPSVHKSGTVYTWVPGRGPNQIQELPDGMFQVLRAFNEKAPRTDEQVDDAARSKLAELLVNPPEVGNRNMWFTQVAGHLARWAPWQDAYEAVAMAINRGNPDPLDDDEVAKICDSIWSAEQAQDRSVPPEWLAEESWRARVSQPAEENGFLVSGGNCIRIQTKDTKSQTIETWPWLNADLKVLGMTHGPSGDRWYEVEVRKMTGEAAIVDTLPAKDASSELDLERWLAKHGCSIMYPDNVYPKRGSSTVRLKRYLEAQDPPEFMSVPALGWHDESESFVTHEGIIRATGAGPYEKVRPDRRVAGWAPYRYGHGDEREARGALRRILEFHFEDTVAVFGSWWAATFLKPQILQQVSQFPFMAIEAPSESGKTRGFFDLMIKLSGYQGGHGHATTAATRDALSANRSGIVWIDDRDDLGPIEEILRQATVEGSLTKKGEGNHDQIVATLRGALLVSGEGLGLAAQKALMDRCIMLHVASPIHRMSLHSDRPQWDDIVEFTNACPDLSIYAGTLVRLALQHTATMRVKDLRVGAGRFADKNAVLRFGARLLVSLTGSDDYAWITDTVDKWVDEAVDTGSENALTLRHIPWALRQYRSERPVGPDPQRNWPATPAFRDHEGIVWFNPTLLADWLRRQTPNTSQRLDTEEALRQQAKQLGLGGWCGDKTAPRCRWRFETNDGKQVYWRCPPDLSAKITARVESEEGDPIDGEDNHLFVQ